MLKAFKLSEITAMQLKCIKQLNAIIDSNPDSCLVEMCREEISMRKHWAMHPSEVQI